jgi:hypothetical protein
MCLSFRHLIAQERSQHFTHPTIRNQQVAGSIPAGGGRLLLLSSVAYFDEVLFTKLFRGCEYLFRTQPDSSSISARNGYSHRVGTIIHMLWNPQSCAPTISSLAS